MAVQMFDKTAMFAVSMEHAMMDLKAYKSSYLIGLFD